MDPGRRRKYAIATLICALLAAALQAARMIVSGPELFDWVSVMLILAFASGQGLIISRTRRPPR